MPRPDDVFQERLYCIRWVETRPDGTEVKHYRAPTEADLEREAKVLALLRERFADWQEQGYIPSRRSSRATKPMSRSGRVGGRTGTISSTLGSCSRWVYFSELMTAGPATMPHSESDSPC